MIIDLMKAAQELRPELRADDLSSQEKLWEHLQEKGYEINDQGFTGNSLATYWAVRKPNGGEIPMANLKRFYNGEMNLEGELAEEYTEALMFLALGNCVTGKREAVGQRTQTTMWETLTPDPRPFKFDAYIGISF